MTGLLTCHGQYNLLGMRNQFYSATPSIYITQVDDMDLFGKGETDKLCIPVTSSRQVEAKLEESSSHCIETTDLYVAAHIPSNVRSAVTPSGLQRQKESN
uniref:Uncharacterized protein n=1 Tax=Ciona intestinalis TaxID=7719 RepID=F6RQX7_CIOIN